MLLAIDIGNTNITIGLFQDKRLVVRVAIPTVLASYQVRMRQVLPKVSLARQAIISSVVPEATRKMRVCLKKLGVLCVHEVGRDCVVPIANRYHKPKQVGQDRLVNAYAARMRYGAPVIVIDFGTAVTFDVVDGRGAYIGGLILPGLRLCMQALYEHTALLPKVALHAPRELIGRDTQSSMTSGVVYGCAAYVDDLVARIRKELGKKSVVIATGGDCQLISRYARTIEHIEPDLTLQGLLAVFDTL